MHHDLTIRPFGRPRAKARGSAIGRRAVALFEATKGVLVLIIGLGLLSVVQHDMPRAGEEIMRRFHLGVAHHYPRLLIDAAMHVDHSRLRFLALAALLYSAVRFLEAYGLWCQRTWAEWFAIVSGGIYLPLELYELISHATTAITVVFSVNLGIVAYLIYVLRRRANGQDVLQPAP